MATVYFLFDSKILYIIKDAPRGYQFSFLSQDTLQRGQTIQFFGGKKIRISVSLLSHNMNHLTEANGLTVNQQLLQLSLSLLAFGFNQSFTYFLR